MKHPIKIGTTHWPVCERCGRILLPSTKETGLCSSCIQDDDPDVQEELWEHYRDRY